MAIYHFSIKIVARSKGQSVVAAAAWQTASTLYDDRIGRFHRYAGKRDIAFEALLVPAGTTLQPATRERLWNQVEIAERYRNAQLARQIDLALPDELGLETNIDLLRAYAEEAFVAFGYSTDIAIVRTHDDGAEHYHGYVMFPTRVLSGSSFAKKKDKSWNRRAKLIGWRKLWADHVNARLEAVGCPDRVDHRSNAERGLLPPTLPHVGVVATKMHRRGVASNRWAEHASAASGDPDQVLVIY